ncbi:hypothetical protein Y1Q_0006031 [Alligator mississippiensis]|uniref:Uncharacterized protein n=1 Tax=Alligator mississippiensis TaxID=8496 RepID=A0A151N3P8_ALLMI|nr:hypothetical protein Y1Q_0006031 [Alligator mississippiensis]
MERMMSLPGFANYLQLHSVGLVQEPAVRRDAAGAGAIRASSWAAGKLPVEPLMGQNLSTPCINACHKTYQVVFFRCLSERVSLI